MWKMKSLIKLPLKCLTFGLILQYYAIRFNGILLRGCGGVCLASVMFISPYKHSKCYCLVAVDEFTHFHVFLFNFSDMILISGDFRGHTPLKIQWGGVGHVDGTCPLSTSVCYQWRWYFAPSFHLMTHGSKFVII